MSFAAVQVHWRKQLCYCQLGYKIVVAEVRCIMANQQKLKSGTLSGHNGVENLWNWMLYRYQFPLYKARAFTSFFFKLFVIWLHCKYLNAWSECNDIVISEYSYYPLDLNAKSSDTKGTTFSIRWFCIRIERVMSVYGNYDVIAFRSCIQIFTV